MLAYGRGDAGAFEHLYRRHKDGLFAFLYRSLPQQAIVEEIAQETWIAVIHAAADYRPSAKFKTWLYQIARNKMVDHWRRRDHHSEVPPPELAHQPAEELPSESELLQAVASLPAEQRDSLLLREQGFSVREVADITGTAEETVKSRIRYGRKQLQAWLGEQR